MHAPRLLGGEQVDTGIGTIAHIILGLGTSFAHLQELRVQLGPTAATVRVIGTLDGSGKDTGPHPRFEVWQGSETIDPALTVRGWAKGR